MGDDHRIIIITGLLKFIREAHSVCVYYVVIILLALYSGRKRRDTCLVRKKIISGQSVSFLLHEDTGESKYIGFKSSSRVSTIHGTCSYLL